VTDQAGAAALGQRVADALRASVQAQGGGVALSASAAPAT